MLNITRIPDEPAGVTAVFKLLPQLNEAKSKLANRPVYDDIEVCEIYLAANKYTQPVFPAHEVWKTHKSVDANGFEVVEDITYAMRFAKQYMEFKSGGPQGITGTPLAELPFLTAGKRLELKALNIHTAEALAALDGSNLKMLGMNGRELKNSAAAYLETAAKTAPLTAMKDELASRDATIAKMQEQIDAMMGSSGPVSATSEAPSQQTVTGFAGFTDEDLKQWLIDANVEVDGRWGNNRLLIECQKVLDKQGKAKQAA